MLVAPNMRPTNPRNCNSCSKGTANTSLYLEHEQFIILKIFALFL